MLIPSPSLLAPPADQFRQLRILCYNRLNASTVAGGIYILDLVDSESTSGDVGKMCTNVVAATTAGIGASGTTPAIFVVALDVYANDTIGIFIIGGKLDKLTVDGSGTTVAKGSAIKAQNASAIGIVATSGTDRWNWIALEGTTSATGVVQALMVRAEAAI